MKTLHTPGPWAVAKYTKRRFGLGQAGDCALYMIQCEYGDTDTDICRADVLVMASAPELLKKIIEASNYIDALGGDSKPYRIAIAKATGEAT